jgi:hypothetical protein
MFFQKFRKNITFLFALKLGLDTCWTSLYVHVRMWSREIAIDSLPGMLNLKSHFFFARFIWLLQLDYNCELFANQSLSVIFHANKASFLIKVVNHAARRATGNPRPARSGIGKRTSGPINSGNGFYSSHACSRKQVWFVRSRALATPTREAIIVIFASKKNHPLSNVSR